MDNQDIFSYIVTEEKFYETRGVPMSDNWEWKMFQHLKLSKLYKNSQLETGNDGSKPIKNIVRPILNVAYRLEGFDVKDITPFVDDKEYYWLSFLVKKYHAKWARKNSLDTFIDDLVESYVDYGGVLVKNVNDKCPEVTPLETIAFCDQTDILSGIIAIKHQYTADQLQGMAATNGWNLDNINTAIDQAQEEKVVVNSTLQAQKAYVPQKYITVYELQGVMPTSWLLDDEAEVAVANENHDYTRQTQIVTFATNTKKENSQGLVLFKKAQKKPVFKLGLRDKVYGRGLGFGGVEELFEDQVWTTYNMIKMKELLDAASLLMLQTTDAAFAAKNKISDLETGQIVVTAAGKPLTQVSITPQNMVAFENAVTAWNDHAKTTGSADDAVIGATPDAGTPFALQQLLTQQGKGLHTYRQGKISDFVAEIYRDWILPAFAKDLAQGDTWLEELSPDEMIWCADQIAENEVKERAIAAFNTGGYMTQEQADQIRVLVKADFRKKGNKQFMQILKGELKKIPIDVEINIAGKQKDLSALTDKLTNIFRQIIANPQVLQIPGIADIFNQIVESAGLNPADFSSLTMPVTTPAAQVKTQVQQNNANPVPAAPVQSTVSPAVPVATPQ